MKKKIHFHLFSNKEKLLKIFLVSHITTKNKQLIYVSVEENMK